jgi:hypothetical protein
VVLEKVAAYGDPRLYAVAVMADRLANSAQPLVSQRTFVSGANGDSGGVPGGTLSLLLNVLLDEKTGLGSLAENPDAKGLKEQTDALTRT